jgi:RNA polymerase sigma-70 factor (ECF subfamily)
MSDELFEHYRPLMFSIAYRMLGTVMDAEDIVQEAYLRFLRTPTDSIESPRAFLSTVVTRLCLNHLERAHTKRETYVGPWLPEPILTAGDELIDTPADHVSKMESISMAFLVLLESLSPAERAVFLLREVFEYDYAEIATILEKSESACRQLFSRARRQVAAKRPRFDGEADAHRKLVTRFIEAVNTGEMAPITEMLAQDVTLWADGGGKTFAALRPVHGQDHVARFILGSQRFTPAGEAATDIVSINGKPSVLLRVDGRPVLVLDFDLAAYTSAGEGERRIRTIRAVANPDKLRNLDAAFTNM